jgi:DNA-binding response OmpR family regulator
MMSEEYKARVLYVEDDPTLGFITKENLEREGYFVDLIPDGKEGWKQFQKSEYDICILDVMLPGIDGFTLAGKIRDINKEVPIIFLTAKTLQEDKIEGLLAGADDYMLKPFSLRELELRMQIFLRRTGVKGFRKGKPETLIPVGILQLDFDNLQLKGENYEMKLTLREAELLKFFCENEGRVISREEILNSVWGEHNYFFGRSLDVFISRLRKYLKPDETLKIDNRHGIGFEFRVLKR